MSKPVVLVTGANGEIGRSLLQTIAESGGFEVVTLDLTLPHECHASDGCRELCRQHHGPVPARPGRRASRGGHGLSPRGAPVRARRARSRARPSGERRGDAQRASHGAEPVGAPRATRPVHLPELDRGLRSAVARGEARHRTDRRGAVERSHHDVRLQQALLRARRPLLHVLCAPGRHVGRRCAPRLSVAFAFLDSSRRTRRRPAERATSGRG